MVARWGPAGLLSTAIGASLGVDSNTMPIEDVEGVDGHVIVPNIVSYRGSLVTAKVLVNLLAVGGNITGDLGEAFRGGPADPPGATTFFGAAGGKRSWFLWCLFFVSAQHISSISPGT